MGSQSIFHSLLFLPNSNTLSLLLPASVARTRTHVCMHKGMKSMLTKSLEAYQE